MSGLATNSILYFCFLFFWKKHWQYLLSEMAKRPSGVLELPRALLLELKSNKDAWCRGLRKPSKITDTNLVFAFIKTLFYTDPWLWKSQQNIIEFVTRPGWWAACAWEVWCGRRVRRWGVGTVALWRLSPSHLGWGWAEEANHHHCWTKCLEKGGSLIN